MKVSGTYGRSLIVALATLVGVAGGVRLGFWQLDRAAQKVALQAQIDARGKLPALESRDLASTRDAVPAQVHRRVVLSGRWLLDRTVFLDNRQMNGRPGFFVVTPLQLDARPEAVLVQRGWVPRSFTDRTALPTLRSSEGRIEVDGLIAPPPTRLYDFAGSSTGPIRQNLDIDAYARETRMALLPLSVLQVDTPASGSPTADGLKRDWPPPALDVQKHYGYAFQWFALAALIAGLYVWFQIIRPLRGHA